MREDAILTKKRSELLPVAFHRIRALIGLALVYFLYLVSVHLTVNLFYPNIHLSPQESLASAVQKQIVKEVASLRNIHTVLFSLDLGIGFLASAGGDKEMLISTYLREILRMPKDRGLRSQKVWCNFLLCGKYCITTRRCKIFLSSNVKNIRHEKTDGKIGERCSRYYEKIAFFFKVAM